MAAAAKKKEKAILAGDQGPGCRPPAPGLPGPGARRRRLPPPAARRLPPAAAPCSTNPLLHSPTGLASVVGLDGNAPAAEVLQTVAETLGCVVADDGTTALAEVNGRCSDVMWRMPLPASAGAWLDAACSWSA